jgi:uncharacterized C2H2 Zn-finger protein
MTTTEARQGSRHDDDDTSISLKSDTVVVFLTLGDGDFSYSLDLARYLSSQSSAALDSLSPSSLLSSTHLVATGIDSLDELTSKYKDSPSILYRLRNEQKTELFSVTVCHGVNAIVRCTSHCDNKNDDGGKQEAEIGPSQERIQMAPEATATTKETFLRQSAHHVIFNHPHLGTENAALHRQFLSHLFYSVDRYWMKKQKQKMTLTVNIDSTTTNDSMPSESKISSPLAPVFHLTLVDGQFERWKCSEAAQRHGFILLGKFPFVPPPVLRSTTSSSNQSLDVTTANNKNDKAHRNAYSYRRHQTGRSFGNRRRPDSHGDMGGSSTYTFGRSTERDTYIATSLPWQVKNSPSSTLSVNSNDSCTDTIQEVNAAPIIDLQQQQLQLLSCPFCEKIFEENRSLKSHVRDKHANQNQNENGEMKSLSNQNKRVKIQKKGLSTEQIELEESTTSQEASKVFFCSFCRQEPTEGEYIMRQFSTQQALEDHIRAKHSGLHRYVAPDWSRAAKLQQQGHSNNHSKQLGISAFSTDVMTKNTMARLAAVECDVCECTLPPGRTLDEHWNDFIPSEGGTISRSYACSWCEKTFREDRAKKQHENFCNKRPTPLLLPDSVS